MLQTKRPINTCSHCGLDEEWNGHCLRYYWSTNSWRLHYHLLLDQAMDATKEGDSFLPKFVGFVLGELCQQSKSQL